MSVNIEDEFPTVPWDLSHLANDVKRLVQDGLGIQRVPNFWTLGMSTYKDGYNNLDSAKVQKSNDFLMTVFHKLYADQLILFSEIFNKPVKYMDGMPIPGFHVFKYCKEFEEPLARPHVDVPFNKYNWGSEVGHEDIFTHVVPVEMPDGAGLNIWDMDALDMHNYGAEAVVMKARTTKPDAFLEYKVGEAVIHSGKIVHQIKPFEKETDKWRITLQSHAVFKDGCWQLYW